MITQFETAAAGGVREAAAPMLWGLDARAFHDAYWSARGVQVVSRAVGRKLDRAAELYLLAEADQLVLFRLVALSERLTWRNAKVTNVRLIDEHSDPYHERVIIEDGCVQRIERRYAPTLYGSYRIVLTPSRRIASLWAGAPTRREGWDRVRRAVPWSRVDHTRCPGRAFREGDPEQERAMLDELVGFWARPDQAIDGLEQLEESVWHLAGDAVNDDTARIGPLWIGRAAGAAPRACLVGPRWLPDRSSGRAAAVRPIDEVEPADPPVRSGAAGRPVYQTVKRAIDIVLSVVGLAIALPIMVVIAMAVLADTGRPLFFGQEREGRGGRSFRCWKFRSMYRNAEQILREYRELNKCDGPQINLKDDPRVTRVGRIIRATHLDELPQLWNVLAGQMSLVGPRPSPWKENQYCPAWRDARLSVRPGITGLWQLMRTREPGEDFQEWIKYDINYVQRAGLWLDLVIMARTAWMLVAGRRRNASK